MSDRLYLICDCVGAATMVPLNEGANGSDRSGPLRFRGKFQEAEAPNKNKRVYHHNVLAPEVERIAEAVSSRKLSGELDHPQDSIIHLENASHLITKLWWDGNLLMGEGEVLPTPAGEILRALIESKMPVGISSRGVGTGKTNEQGMMIIDEGYRLITFDVVADPSTDKAYCTPMHENNKPSTSGTKPVAPQGKGWSRNSPQAAVETRVTRPATNKINTIDSALAIGMVRAAIMEAMKR